MRRPDRDEHDAYYSRYIDLVPDGDVIDTLQAQMQVTRALLATVQPDQEEYRYAPGKWSVREVVGHLIDTERVFGFRCVWVARGAAGEQPGMEQDDWAAASNAGSRALGDLLAEWAGVRRDHASLFRGFDDDAWARVGSASGRPFSARTFPWVIAGHELHHRALLERDYQVGPRR